MTTSLRTRRRRRNLLTITSLGLVGLLAGLLTGCSASSSPTTTVASPTSSAPSYAELAGNWQISSSTPANAGLSSLGGSLAVSGSTVSGVLHPLAGSCVTPANSSPFRVTGAISAAGVVTLASTNFAGGVLHLTGTLAADQHSLLDPAVSVSGGSCASVTRQSLLAPEDNSTITIAQQYQPIRGTYTGSFSDPGGVVMAVSAVLSQSSSPDASGYYHLTGDATFANNPCLNAPVITDSTINGASITATYTDAQTGNSIVGTGTFDATAANLSITQWSLSGSCGADQGTGLLTKH